MFFVLSGRWRFFWGRWGNAGEVVLEKGDIINIPTGIFRGFENIGTDYGMIMAVLGGDDAGGGVIWAPQVIEDAKNHGLILSDQGKLYDTKKGEKLPDNIKSSEKFIDKILNENKIFIAPGTIFGSNGDLIEKCEEIEESQEDQQSRIEISNDNDDINNEIKDGNKDNNKDYKLVLSCAKLRDV